jgi:hypothetical protein
VERFLKRVAKHLSQVPILQPFKFLPHLVSIDGWFLPLGEILEIIFQVPKALKEFWMGVFPFDLTVIQLIDGSVRFMLPIRPALVRRWIGLVGLSEDSHGVPRLNPVFPNSHPGFLVVYSLNHDSVTQIRIHNQCSIMPTAARHAGEGIRDSGGFASSAPENRPIHNSILKELVTDEPADGRRVIQGLA